ncbi:MAG: hypothetical protein HOQ22_14055 [Nocardioidaceae bacterium]|nr:hypothetical protein [Nocardioidaceae bacterium]NUS52149.1 hypothetical protein [Nocardioidaceae bacterium]
MQPETRLAVVMSVLTFVRTLAISATVLGFLVVAGALGLRTALLLGLATVLAMAAHTLGLLRLARRGRRPPPGPPA